MFNEAASCKRSLTSCGYIDKLTMYGKVCKTKEIKKKAKETLHGLMLQIAEL